MNIYIFFASQRRRWFCSKQLLSLELHSLKKKKVFTFHWRKSKRLILKRLLLFELLKVYGFTETVVEDLFSSLNKQRNFILQRKSSAH
ncbi:hypothetical protein CS542_06135 [Pedobacter sp. IW39]|nr:hypothetical protein CS542_06135 [Pedobacter sp. IW39]